MAQFLLQNLATQLVVAAQVRQAIKDEHAHEFESLMRLTDQDMKENVRDGRKEAESEGHYLLQGVNIKEMKLPIDQRDNNKPEPGKIDVNEMKIVEGMETQGISVPLSPLAMKEPKLSKFSAIGSLSLSNGIRESTDLSSTNPLNARAAGVEKYLSVLTPPQHQKQDLRQNLDTRKDGIPSNIKTVDQVVSLHKASDALKVMKELEQNSPRAIPSSLLLEELKELPDQMLHLAKDITKSKDKSNALKVLNIEESSDKLIEIQAKASTDTPKLQAVAGDNNALGALPAISREDSPIIQHMPKDSPQVIKQVTDALRDVIVQDLGHTKSIKVQLEPAHLGEVEISLQVDDHKQVSANIYARNPDTLEMLRRDGRVLLSILNSSGIDMDMSNMNFSGGEDKNQGKQSYFRSFAMSDEQEILTYQDHMFNISGPKNKVLDISV